MSDLEHKILQDLERVKESERKIIQYSVEQINSLLLALADKLENRQEGLIAANKKDLARMDPANPKYDRLLLGPERITEIANDIRNVVKLPCPVYELLEKRTLENGLELEKRRVPIGTICIVYESRPNVTFDVFTLCLKTYNVCVLKGSRDAHDSNEWIVDCIQETLMEHQMDANVIYLAPSERESLMPILRADQFIDAVIPRGSQGLINFVRENAKVPVIETGAGVVHTYVDKSANFKKASDIVRNSKTRRVSVCNALDTLIIHRDMLAKLPEMMKGLDQEFELEVYADERALKQLKGKYADNLLHEATPEHFGTEFLAMKMSIKVVDNFDEALDHIYRYSSKHSESVVAEDPIVIDRYFKEVDAAVVYANASTAFTDGAQFGLGAEIGISTQKLHARGPMALPEMTSYKWIVKGDGQIRP